MSGLPALLLAAIDVPEALVAEFNAWYDGEHVPERLAIPGIRRVRRWERVSGDTPRFLALFDAADEAVFAGGAYAALKARGDTERTARLRPKFERFFRGIFAEQELFAGGGGAAVACAVALTSLPVDDEAAYRAWYREHGPAVAAVAGVALVRRLEQEAEPRHATIVELTDADALAGDAYATAKAATPDPGLRARWRREQGLYRLLREWRA